MASIDNISGAIFFFATSLPFILEGARNYILYKKIRNTPTSTVRAAMPGIVELFGKAKMKSKTISPISGERCAYWRTNVEHIIETMRGETRIKVGELHSGSPFYLEDKTGKMLIDPEDANVAIPSDHAYEGFFQEGFDHSEGSITKDMLLDKKALEFLNKPECKKIKDGLLRQKGLKVGITEYYIAPGDMLYVLGSTQVFEGAASSAGYKNLVVKKSPPENIMFISNTPESELTQSLFKSSIVTTALGLIMFAAGVFLLLLSMGIENAKVNIFRTRLVEMAALEICSGFALLVIGLLAAFYVVSIYNGLIRLRNNIDKAWSNIDVLLKQRSDLIPNLVKTVKGYMKHEKGVLTEITRLRTSVLKADDPSKKAEASEKISKGLKTLFAVAEKYPKLRASENFLDLQDKLTAIENQIADRREFYNNSVLLFNTRIQVIPDSIVAALLGMKQKRYFAAKEAEKKLVEVQFGE